LPLEARATEARFEEEGRGLTPRRGVDEGARLDLARAERHRLGRHEIAVVAAGQGARDAEGGACLGWLRPGGLAPGVRRRRRPCLATLPEGRLGDAVHGQGRRGVAGEPEGEHHRAPFDEERPLSRHATEARKAATTEVLSEE
jgi:hypothetical protein